MREYCIPHVGLKLGNHHFEYLITGAFFQHFEKSIISNCSVKVKVDLEKKETFFLLRFFIDGVVNVICDRCSEAFDKEIFGDFQVLIKYSDTLAKESNDDDEIVYISRDADFIDLSQLIYEYITLSIPMQVLHPVDQEGNETCNPEVLKVLHAKNEKPMEDDPRWAALKNLKFDSN